MKNIVILFLIFALAGCQSKDRSITSGKTFDKDVIVNKTSPSLFLKGEGAVIDFSTSDLVLTQSTNALTLTGGDIVLNGTSDTTATAVKGKIVFKTSDSSFYMCRSTTFRHKWYKLN